MSFSGRIKRGPMAADVLQRQFTQIHNALFRDPRMSFKAKGIFGLISTHVDGFGVSEESITGCATDGLSAVRTGLKELIEFGYLQRRRERNELGHLGESEYYITDMPEGLTIILSPGWDTPKEDRRSDPTRENRTLDGGEETPRSEPTCDSPGLAEPRLDDHPHKKITTPKKTTETNTNPIHPSVRDARAHETDGGMDGGREFEEQEAEPVPAGGLAAAAGEARGTSTGSLAAVASVVPVPVTPGVELLLAIGAERPELLLSGQTLRDQGLTLTGMLVEGWSGGHLRHVIAGRELPSPLRKTVGAVIAARLRAALATPPPSSVAFPEQTSAERDATRRQEPVLSTTEAAAWSVTEATSRRVSYECQGEQGTCGRPVSGEGALCHHCAPRPAAPGADPLIDMSWEERLAVAVATADQEEYYASGQDLVDARGV
ncbi:hypothetical protein ACFC7A_31615 [Streptomyces niveus]|uniref:hypothetical protein n=1 Tax=Streptomyces niveus TaxID=193462 RepID=UPI0035D6C66F